MIKTPIALIASELKKEDWRECARTTNLTRLLVDFNFLFFCLSWSGPGSTFVKFLKLKGFSMLRKSVIWGKALPYYRQTLRKFSSWRGRWRTVESNFVELLKLESYSMFWNTDLIGKCCDTDVFSSSFEERRKPA